MAGVGGSNENSSTSSSISSCRYCSASGGRRRRITSPSRSIETYSNAASSSGMTSVDLEQPRALTAELLLALVALGRHDGLGALGGRGSLTPRRTVERKRLVADRDQHPVTLDAKMIELRHVEPGFQVGDQPREADPLP